MRKAELTTGFVLAFFSVYLMWKSTELPIGWIKDYGPGGGAFPFWLALGMFICTVLILVRSFMGVTPESQSTEPFLNPESKRLFFVVTGSLTAMIVLAGGIKFGEVTLFPSLGVYVAIPAFLIFYMRHLGKHSWRLTLTISIVTPVVTFLFFEKLLIITLPKGVTEEFFYLFY